MILGRLCGDSLVHRYGPVRLTRVSGIVAIVGLSAGVASQNSVAAVVGFSIFGAGLSLLAPILFSAAGNLGDVVAARAISHMALLSYLGFFVGPPIIGFVASATNLSVGLLVPALLATAFVFGANAARTASGHG